MVGVLFKKRDLVLASAVHILKKEIWTQRHRAWGWGSGEGHVTVEVEIRVMHPSQGLPATTKN